MVNLAAYFLTALSLMCCFFPNVLADAGSIADHSTVVEKKIDASLLEGDRGVNVENAEDSNDDVK